MAYDKVNRKLYTTTDAEGNKIGIPLWEIMQCLAYFKRDKNGYRNLGTIIKNAPINKWALYKPVRHATKEPITVDERIAIRCGLSPVSVTKLLEKSIGMPVVEHTKEDCLAEISEWLYHRPMGGESQPFRSLDFDGYNHLALAPDAGWTQKEISADMLTNLKNVSVELTNTGTYATYNFKMQPKINGSDYNSGLYQSFAMRFGENAGEGINESQNMEIPISYVASIDGNYRIALAVWVPNFGTAGGWGFFASRMTIAQYFAENLGSGDSLRNLFPDLASNPSVAGMMYDHVIANNGYATFDVVPLLVKDLGTTVDTNGKFQLHPVENVTEAYCMPSGSMLIPFICGEPPMTIYYRISTEQTSVGAVGVFLENTDTEAAHKFGYYYTQYYPDQDPVQSAVISVTLQAGEKRQVVGYPSQAGYGATVKVVSQDDVEINN